MSRPRRRNEQLLAELSRAVRRMGIQTVVFHQVLAEKLGLSATDSRALSIVDEIGPIPAGQLAELTGLTTGAVTGIIDRLEQGGWVRRETDPQDRRRVMVESVRDPERERVVAGLFESLRHNFARLASRYDDEELALILEFITSGTELMRDETRKLRGGH
ncbi:MAG: MarR family winged helix-turn-helix transcriptional regulator [Longimicrobiales bacterium]